MTLLHYEILSILIFLIGMTGMLIKRDTIAIFISAEIMLSAANLHFIAISKFTENLDGHVIVLFVMGIAAAEAAVGLALFINLFRKFRTIDSTKLNEVRG